MGNNVLYIADRLRSRQPRTIAIAAGDRLKERILDELRAILLGEIRRIATAMGDNRAAALAGVADKTTIWREIDNSIDIYSFPITRVLMIMYEYILSDDLDGEAIEKRSGIAAEDIAQAIDFINSTEKNILAKTLVLDSKHKPGYCRELVSRVIDKAKNDPHYSDIITNFLIQC